MCRPDEFPPYGAREDELFHVAMRTGTLADWDAWQEARADAGVVPYPPVQQCDMDDPAHAAIHDEMSRRHAEAEA